MRNLGGISFAGFVKDSLGLLQLKMPATEEIRERARDKGYNQAKEEHQIWYYCAVCGKRMDMEPNTDAHKAMIRFMKEHGWGHTSCHEK